MNARSTRRRGLAWRPLPRLLSMPRRRLHHLREEDYQRYVAYYTDILASITPPTRAGILRDGGYAEYAILRSEAVVALSDNLDPAEAAPLLCTAVTCF
ncbi:hypothetical protein BD309DRAFT_230250 [Dichomitus squalens]|nr:hypothetical protein BD309DRAFT_230250 [Dichomitus squalens]